jgi:glycosyltransferase involved in cell wall biosynthesis
MQWWAGPESVDYAYGTVLRDSDALIVMSDRHRQMLSERNPAVEKKSVLIPPPPLLTMTSAKDEGTREQTRAQLGLTSSHFVLVYFGLIYPVKGVETLLKAFHLVSRDRSWVRLVLVGGVVAHAFPDRPRFAEEMRELPKQLGFDEKIIWTGEFATDSNEASRYLYASDACVFSHDHGLYLNNSSFAAVATHGLPIVATRGSFVEEQFVDGENLIFCQPKSPESMAAAIRRVVDDHELRRRIAKGALQLAAEWFSWEKATDRTIELLVGGRPSC